MSEIATLILDIIKDQRETAEWTARRLLSLEIVIARMKDFLVREGYRETPEGWARREPMPHENVVAYPVEEAKDGPDGSSDGGAVAGG
jgi:hypothetical protein